jgi:hypothetical protein
MRTLFLTSNITPSKLDDDGLEMHIKMLFLRLKSITIEMEESWNKPGRDQLNAMLRAQLNEVSAQLTAAQSVYQFRIDSMR